MQGFILFLVIIALLWLLALELRFHSLKNVVSESRQLADEAASIADNAIAKLREFIADHGRKPTPPAGKSSRR